MEHEFCAIYLSGTGNTKYCVSRLLQLLDEGAPCVAIEDMVAVSIVKAHENIILGYPVQFSNVPKMVREFILQNRELWRGKRVLCVATMGAFSGDGAGCAARLLKKCGAKILGGLHLKMPDSVCDSKLLKKSKEEKRDSIRRAEEKIGRVAGGIEGGKYPRDGLGFFAHMAGLFGQRLWFYGRTRKYSDKLKIDKARCVGCGVCASLCPMKNLTVENGLAVPHGKCTMCYRCISRCPQRAVTLVGKEVVEQYRVEDFVGGRLKERYTRLRPASVAAGRKLGMRMPHPPTPLPRRGQNKESSQGGGVRGKWRDFSYFHKISVTEKHYAG